MKGFGVCGEAIAQGGRRKGPTKRVLCALLFDVASAIPDQPALSGVFGQAARGCAADSDHVPGYGCVTLRHTQSGPTLSIIAGRPV